MSEENQDKTAVPVTNPVKTHVKDPRRVESGRRLAKINKEAKARKKAQLEAIKEEEQSIPEEGSIVTLERVGLVLGIAVGLGSLYFMWCSRQQKSEKLEESKSVEEPKPIRDLLSIPQKVLTYLTEKKYSHYNKNKMTDTKKEVTTNCTLLTTGVVGVSYLAKTVAGKSLGAPMTLEGSTNKG
jgi:hypothetical protein